MLAAYLKVVLGFFGSESTTVPQQINEANSNTTIDVEDEVVLLRGGDTLNRKGVIKELVGWEALLNEFLDEFNTQVRVVSGLDLVTYARDCEENILALRWDEKMEMARKYTKFVLLSHGINKVSWTEPFVECISELSSSTIQSTTKPLTNSQETGNESGDQVLSSSGSDNGVHCTRHSWAMVGSQHENHLQKFGGILWKSSPEPKEGHNTANTNVFLEDIGNWHTRIKKLLPTVIGDSGDEGSWLTNKPKLLSPGVVDGDLWWLWLWLGDDNSLGHQVLVDLPENLWELLEGIWDEKASITHGFVLGFGSLELGVCEGTGVSKLNFGGKHRSTRSDCPCNNWLGNLSIFDSFNNTIFLNTTDFSEEHEDLAFRVDLISIETVRPPTCKL